MMDDNFKRAALWAPFSPLVAGYHAVKGLVDTIVPETTGGLFTDPRTSAAGLNRPRWAKITDSTGSKPVLYGWEEQTFQPLVPGGATSIGFVKADAGITGTVNRGVILNPIIEPNGKDLAVGDYVLVRAEYFDPAYDVVFTVVGGGAGGGAAAGAALVKCLGTTPTSGRYDARLQVLNADGTLSDTGASVWLRDGNNTPALLNGEVYLCTLTGSTSGRSVYTTCDFNLTVRDQAQLQSEDRTLYLELGALRCWSITRPVGGSRRTLINRLLNARKTGGTIYSDLFQFTFDPATNWTVDDADNDGDVLIQRELRVREGTSVRTTFTWQVDFDATDFDVAATATGHATVNTAGYTGSFCVATSCTAGVLKGRLLSFTNGLLKTVGAEVDLASCG